MGGRNSKVIAKHDRERYQRRKIFGNREKKVVNCPSAGPCSGPSTSEFCDCDDNTAFAGMPINSPIYGGLCDCDCDCDNVMQGGPYY